MELGPHNLPRSLAGLIMNMPMVHSFTSGDRTVWIYSPMQVESTRPSGGATMDDGSTIAPNGQITFRNPKPDDKSRRIVTIWQDKSGKRGSYRW